MVCIQLAYVAVSVHGGGETVRGKNKTVVELGNLSKRAAVANTCGTDCTSFFDTERWMHTVRKACINLKKNMGLQLL